MIQQILAFDLLAQQQFMQRDSYINRYCYQQIDTSSKIVGITGLRGVGKSSYLINRRLQDPKSLYISCDLDFIDPDNFLTTIIELYQSHSITTLLLDEIHFLPNRAAILKNLYDFTSLQIIYSGSSMIHLLHSGHDLSRRVLQYIIPIFSYREFLSLTHQTIIQSPISMTELVQNYQILSKELSKYHTKSSFETYIQRGQFGYYQEETSQTSYQQKLNNSLKKSLYEDIAQFYSMKTSSLPFLEKIIYYLANTSSSEVNHKKIADMLGVDNKTITIYLSYLEQLGRVYRIDKYGTLSDQMRKQQKIYFSNTNIVDYLITQDNSNKKGIIRETLTMQMLQISSLYQSNQIYHLTSIDFVIQQGNQEIYFEVGGKGKTKKQGFVIADDIQFGEGNKIPLWLLGFLG